MIHSTDRIKVFLALLLTVSLLVLTSCSNRSRDVNDNTETSGDSETILTTKTNEEYDSSNEDDSETVSVTPRSSNDWKRAYVDYILNGNEGLSDYGYYDEWNEDTYFMLVDVNDDEIPELFRSGGSIAQGQALVTYANGKIKIIDSYVSSYTFMDNSDYLWRQERDRAEDIEYYRYFKFNHGDLKLILEGAAIDPRYDRNEKYMWDGKEVSQQTFEAHIKEIESIDDSDLYYSEPLLEQEMVRFIEHF